MIVCICRGVNEHAIARAVREGSDTVKAVARCTRAGTGCGRCHDAIQRTIERTARGSERDGASPLLPLLAASAT